MIQKYLILSVPGIGSREPRSLPGCHGPPRIVRFNLTRVAGQKLVDRLECSARGRVPQKGASRMEDSERKPLTGREKTIIFGVLILTALILGLWILAIVLSMPEPSHGIV